VFVGAEVVNAQRHGPRDFARGFAVEEKDVGFYALGLEDPGRQAQQGVNVALLQKFPAHGLAGAALE
jgi:hypothetical protein